MSLKNFYEANDDLRFIAENFIDWNSFVPKLELDFKDAKTYQKTNDDRYSLAPSNTQEAVNIYQETFHQYGEIIAKEVAPASQKIDSEGLRFESGKVIFSQDTLRLLDIFVQSGILATALSRKYGGLMFPYSAQSIITEMLSQVDASFAITLGCFNISAMVERYGSEEIKDRYLPKVSSGKITAAMALTEPDYGSDLSHIETKAVKIEGENNLYEITGAKRFITHGCGVGDSPSLILTLARSSGSGAKGLSFFLVESTDVEIGGIENKLGLHASPTCEVIYDKSKAILLGEEGKGLVKYAIEMMNGARVGIAVQSVGIAEAAYQEALQYSSERVQFGKTIDQIPAIKRILKESQALVQAIRAVTFKTAEVVDIYESFRNILLEKGLNEKEVKRDPEVKKWDKLAKLFTPVSKYFASEQANRIVYLSAQVFGGSGFIEDYPIAKLYRDVRITTIYEGTSQLQVVGAIGGIVEGMKENSILNQYLEEEINKINKIDQEELKKFKAELHELVQAYKAKEREEKDTMAQDIVDYFCVFFALFILSLHEKVAFEKKHSILESKKSARQNFRILAKRVMEAVKVQIFN